MKSQHAFSLIEMLITLIITMILMGISIPMLTNFFSREDSELLQLQLLNALQFAHLEARAKHVPVGVCKSDNQKTCSGNWTDGLLVFIDASENGMITSRQQILAVKQIKKNNHHLYWRSFPYYRNYLQFLPSGLMQNNNGTFWCCHANSKSPVWAIMISKSGRTRVIYPDQTGEIKDGAGKVLPCVN